MTSAQVRSVAHTEEGVALNVLRQGRAQMFTADKLLIATSRRPNTEALGLEQVGVEADQTGAVWVDRTLRTTVPHIWAAGDVIGDLLPSFRRVAKHANPVAHK